MGKSREPATKAELRRELEAKRRLVSDRAERSARAIARLGALGIQDEGLRVLWYLSIRTEVETVAAVRRLVQLGREVVVPYCDGPDLKLWLLNDFETLAPAGWGILEPRRELRSREANHVDPGTLDRVVVPGLGFTAGGDRLGYGAGYYDRLLASTRARRIGLCFEAQVVPWLPTDGHDMRMHTLVTEDRTVQVDGGL